MTKHELPANLIPESHAVVRKISDSFDINSDVELSKTEYGHAMANLARGIQAGADVFDAERQKKHLRDSVLELLKKFGPRIVPLLREELQGILTKEEISEFEK